MCTATISKIFKFTRKVKDGTDAVRYWLVPSTRSIVIAENGDARPHQISCQVMKQTGDSAPVVLDFPLNSGLSVVYGSIPRQGSAIVFQRYNGGVMNFGSAISSESMIEFKLRMDNIVIDSVSIPIISDGKTGDRGATLRGPQSWSDCVDGYEFQCGDAGNEWKDVVMYKDDYYVCVKSHTKTDNNYPGSPESENNGFWRLGDRMELTATQILLSNYALVKNLGVESIDMRDAAGNILFQAKDGNVICRTGVFENIKVSGDLTANTLNLKISDNDLASAPPNGSICFRTSQLILEELPEGTSKVIKVLNPGTSRSEKQPLILQPATARVAISVSMDDGTGVHKAVTIPEGGFNGSKYFELLGVGFDDGTVWYLAHLNNN